MFAPGRAIWMAFKNAGCGSVSLAKRHHDLIKIYDFVVCLSVEKKRTNSYAYNKVGRIKRKNRGEKIASRNVWEYHPLQLVYRNRATITFTTQPREFIMAVFFSCSSVVVGLVMDNLYLIRIKVAHKLLATIVASVSVFIAAPLGLN